MHKIFESDRRWARVGLLAVALAGCDAAPAEPGPELHRAYCEQHFECNCDLYLWADVDACMRDEAAVRAGWLAAIDAAGLTPDAACMDRMQAPDPEACLTWEEYEARHPVDLDGEETLCGACSFASGDRGVGEPCTEFNWYGNVSDCAPGLVCVGARSPSGVCLDPCAPTPAGLPCERGVNVCAEGLDCDVDDDLCGPLAGPGEDCASRLCVDGYMCTEEDRCVALPGPDEPCLEGRCDWRQGLWCAADEVCRPPPQAGEACDGACAGELLCHPFEAVCTPPGRAGDGCLGDHHCEPGLNCVAKVCKAGGEVGEPCSDGGDPCRLGLSCVDEVCGAGQAWMCR